MVDTGQRTFALILRSWWTRGNNWCFAPVGSTFCISDPQLSDCFLLSRSMLDPYLHIYLSYNDSCYFWKVTLLNDDRLEMSERFALDYNLWINRAIYVSTYQSSCVNTNLREIPFFCYFLPHDPMGTYSPGTPCKDVFSISIKIYWTITLILLA